MNRINRFLDRMMARAAFPMALLSALLMFYDALQANYAGVAWNFFWCMLLFAYHVDKLQLEQFDRRYFTGVDHGTGVDFTAVMDGYVRRDRTIVITNIRRIATT